MPTEGRHDLTAKSEERFNVRILPCNALDAVRNEAARLGAGTDDPAGWTEKAAELLPCLGARIDLDPTGDDPPGPDSLDRLETTVRTLAPTRGVLVLPDLEARRASGKGLLLLGPARALERMSGTLGEDSGALAGELGACLAKALAAFRNPPRTLDLGTRRLDLERPVILGVLNVTPDSFSDGGRFLAPDRALDHAHRMVAEGADLIDVGGESTRPGAASVSAAEEMDRVLPVVEALAKELEAPLSIDTSKASVADAAVRAGACLVNDVTALSGDPEMGGTVAGLGCGLLVMHMRGEPRTMQDAPRYRDLLGEISRALRRTARIAVEAGVHPGSIAVDPGFGFGKTVAHNLEILARLSELTALGFPLALGTSRKSTLGHLTGRSPDERMAGTAATVALAVQAGARIVRVHDVSTMRDVALVTQAVCDSVQSEDPTSAMIRPAEAPR